MGIAKWILQLKDGIAKAMINALASMLLVAVGTFIGFIFWNAKLGATTGQAQVKLEQEFDEIKLQQDTTQLRQQQMLNIMIEAIDSLSDSMKNLQGDVNNINEKLTEMKIDDRERDADIKENKRDIKELIRMIK